MWRRSSSITARRQSAIAKQAKERSDNARIWLVDQMIDDKLNPDGSKGAQQESLTKAIDELGLRDPAFIERYQELVNKNEARATLGLEDNSPAQGYLNQMTDLEFQALDKNWSSEKLSSELNKIRTKVRNEFAKDPLKKLQASELKEINSKFTSILKTFKDADKNKLQVAKNEAAKSLKDRLGGSDKAFKQFNFRRNEIVNDAIEAAHLLIERGMDDDKAVDKILKLVKDNEDEGVQSFNAIAFEDELKKKAKSGLLTDTEIYQLENLKDRAKKPAPVIKEPVVPVLSR